MPAVAPRGQTNIFGPSASARFVPVRLRCSHVTEDSVRATPDVLVRTADQIREEYREWPALNLTKAQIQRLWRLDAPACDAVLDALLAAHVLRRTEGGTYIGTR
jgi:hypothetical protein